MTSEEALVLLDAVLQGQKLRDVQEQVFRYAWQGWTYPAIADQLGYDTGHIRDVGSALWQQIAQAVGEKVNKNNVQAVLRRQMLQKPIPQDFGANRKQYWGEAIDVSIFYGREEELTLLEQWIVSDRCRLIGLLGMGGIGKTALSVKLAEQIQDQFEFLIWRSLRNAPPLQDLLTVILQVLSNQQATDLPPDIDGKLSRLVEYLRQHRCLLILDNVEPVLHHPDYRELFKQIGEIRHQSCFVLTSREKPREIGFLEGNMLPVRSLQLLGLKQAEARELFRAKGEFSGSEHEWNTLIQHYAGNPLALKMVAAGIQALLDGSVSECLALIAQGTFLFDDIRDLLNQQFDRLSALEKEVMYWLAIEREPVAISALQENLLSPVSCQKLPETVRSLVARSLIEKTSLGFTQQPVVMEYTTERIIEQVCEEITTQKIAIFNHHALMKATAKDYVREAQIRLILKPLVDQLLTNSSQKRIENQLNSILCNLRTRITTADDSEQSPEPGYAGGNILNLLCQLGTDLSGYDFSNLTLWQAYLQTVNLHHVNCTRSNFDKCVFTETFGGILYAALSPDGMLLATSDTEGDICLWRVIDGQLLSIYKGHPCLVWSLAFSPNGQTLASGSEDETIKLWDINTGQCRSTLQSHTNSVFSVAFSPDGETVASGSFDRTIKLWDVKTGECLKTLQGHTERVWSIAISPDGRMLASGSSDKTVKIWDVRTGTCLKTLQGHTQIVQAVAFSLDRYNLLIASGGSDRTLKLWDATTGACLETLQGHLGPIFSTAFSPDGKMLASAGYDRIIRVWSVSTGDCLRTLPGHTNRIWSVMFSSDGATLVSGGDDHAAKFWDVKTSQCFKTIQGHNNPMIAVAFHPAGQWLASGNEDQTVKLWDISSGQCFKVFAGHTDRVMSIAFSPNGQTLLSSSGDRDAKLWDVNHGQCLKTLQGHSGILWAAAFSPKGDILATGGEDSTVRLWDARTGDCLQILQGHSNAVFAIAFSPNGQTLVSGDRDANLNLWDALTGQCLHRLQGHTRAILSLAFSSYRSILASGSSDQSIKLWDTRTGQCFRTLQGHTGGVWAVALSSDSKILASGGDDRLLRLWDVSLGQCLKALPGHTNMVS